MNLDSQRIVRVLMEERGKLFSYIWAIVGDAHLAEDVFQEVSLLAVEKGGEVAGEPQLRAWLRSTARYKSLQAMREIKTPARSSRDDAVIEKLDEYWIQYDATPESDLVETLRDCIRLLSPNGRKMMVLRYSKELRSSQIAQRLKRQLATVRRSIARAHQSLFECVSAKLAAEETGGITMSEARAEPVSNRAAGEDFADLVACHLANELDDVQRERLNAELLAQPDRRRQFVAMCIQSHLFAVSVDPEFTTDEYLDDFADGEDSPLIQVRADFAPPMPSCLPWRSPVWHGRQSYLGLAGGVPACGRDSRAGAVGRRSGACIAASGSRSPPRPTNGREPGARAVMISPRPLGEGQGVRAMCLLSSVASPAWSIVCGRVQGSGFRVQKTTIRHQKSEIRSPWSPFIPISPRPRAPT